MHPTKNDLPEATRTRIVNLCNSRLADAIDLQTQTKYAHWNVRGPNFIALHKLFDKINEDVEEYVDLIAERAVQLGGDAEGTARTVARKSSLDEYGATGSTGPDHVQALAAALAAFAERARRAIDESDQLGDLGTSDIFTEISRGVDKWLWMVEAHLETEKGKARGRAS